MVINTQNLLYLEVALFEKIKPLKNLDKFMGRGTRMRLRRLEDALNTALPMEDNHGHP